MSGYDFSKWLNNVYVKEQDCWIKDVSSKAVKQAIMNGDRAFKNFFKGLSKFPRFKKKNDQHVKAKPAYITIEDLNVRGMMKKSASRKGSRATKLLLL